MYYTYYILISRVLLSTFAKNHCLKSHQCPLIPVIVYQGFGDTNIGQQFVLQEFYSFDRKFKVQIRK